MEMGKEKFLECSHGDHPLADMVYEIYSILRLFLNLHPLE